MSKIDTPALRTCFQGSTLFPNFIFSLWHVNAIDSPLNIGQGFVNQNSNPGFQSSVFVQQQFEKVHRFKVVYSKAFLFV